METTTSANAKRNINIKIAAEAIDGTLLSPGEVFSLNDVVGKRTQARGYRTATVFVNAEKVPGVGGGVSQITGTLFNAAALAGLSIKEVNPHSRPVAYLPVGRDATVAYGDLDLKFANNTKAPVYIAYSFDNPRLRATIFGAKTAGRKVSLRPVVQRLGPGKVNAQLYRVIKQSGKVTAKERLLNHQYRWKPE
jgi:vancomycin resistance protein YoaR